MTVMPANAGTEQPRRVTVVGAGAMGSVFGSALARGGHDVTLFDLSSEHVDAVNQNGLTVESSEGPTVTRVRATTMLAPEVSPEVVLVFVKAYQTQEAIANVKHILGPQTVVLSLQNGWGNADELMAHVDAHHIVLGVTFVSAMMIGPGRVRQTATGKTTVGAVTSKGGPSAQLILRLFEAAGMEVMLSEDIKSMIWRKLVVNASANPTGALTSLTSGAMGEPGPVRDLVDAIAAEVVAVGEAAGFASQTQATIEDLHAVLLNAGATKPSMLQDFEARRRSEIEFINGAVVRMAKQHGLDAPLNEAMYALVKGTELAREIA